METVGCIDEQTATAYAHRMLSTDAVRDVDNHTHTCESCRDLLAVICTEMTTELNSQEQRRMDMKGTHKLAYLGLSRYQGLRQIGEGSLGEVYSAEDPKLQRKVVIKVLRRHGVDEELVRGAQVMAGIRHSNVATVYEIDRDGEEVFIVMEFVEGTSVGEFWHRETHWRKRLELLILAGRGVVAAHTKGVVHRDLKPSNIMTDGKRAQILDFGLAQDRATHLSPDAQVLEMSNAGTPAYMAPERFRGQSATQSSDQFSYATVIFEAIHQFRPFAGETVEQLQANLLAGVLDDKPLNSDVPGVIQDVIRRGLSVEPGDRFDSVEEFLNELHGSMKTSHPKQKVVGALSFLVTIFSLFMLAPWQSCGNEPSGELAYNVAGLPEEMHDAIADDPTGATIHRLSNGMTVYIGTNLDTPNIHARLVIRAGSRDSPQSAPSSADLLGRMMDKGTSQIGTTDFQAESVHLERIAKLYRKIADQPLGDTRQALLREVDSETQAAAQYVVPGEFTEIANHIGSIDPVEVRTYTTAFGATVQHSRFAAWARLESLRITDPVFRMFRSELGLILRERYQKRENSSTLAAMNAIDVHLLGGENIEQVIDDLYLEPYGAIQEFYDTWYHPNNAAIVLVGSIRAQEALPVLEKAFAHWKPKRLPARAVPQKPEIPGNGSTLVTGGRYRRGYLAWLFPKLTVQHKILRPLFYRAYTEHAQSSASNVRAEFLDAEDRGGLVLSARPGGTESTDQVLKVLQDSIDLMTSETPTQEELAKIIRGILQKEVSQMSPLSVAREFTRVFGVHGSWKELRQQWKELQSMQVADLQELLAEIQGTPFTVFSKPGPLPKRKPLLVTAIQFAEEPKQSVLGNELLQSDFVQLSPQFLYEGGNYQYVEEHSQVHIRSEASGEWWSLALYFDVGVKSLPLLLVGLNAVIASAESEVWTTRQVVVTTELNHTVVKIRMTNQDIEVFWDLLRRVLGGETLTQQRWQHAVSRYSDSIKRLRDIRPSVHRMLEEYALKGKNSWYLAVAKSSEIQQKTVSDVQDSLRGLLQYRPSSAYWGRKLDDTMEEKLRRGRAVENIEGPQTILPGGGDIWLANQKGGAANANVSILIPLPSLGHRAFVTAQILSFYWQRMSEQLSQKLQVPISVRVHFDQESEVLSLRCEPPYNKTQQTIEYIVGSIQSLAITDRELAELKKQVDEDYKAQWTRARDIPTVVYRWHNKGFDTDPNIPRFNSLYTLGLEEIESLKQRLIEDYRVVLTGELQLLDLAQLSALGNTHNVPLEDFLPQ